MAEAASEKLKFTYFQLFAKGPACALALNHSGLDWEGAFASLGGPGTPWPELKPRTPWRELPVLEIPGIGTIGHELAILNYIARAAPAMGGSTNAEFAVSQQLMQEAEDIYKKLGQIQNTKFVSGKDAAVITEFWNASAEEALSKHNKDFTVNVYMALLEAFYTSCGVVDGKFTSTGTTVGECKLWTMLHICKLIKDDVLAAYPGLSAFYDRFHALDATQEVLTSGARMPGPFEQYFL